jgi:hypothetical protein
MAVDIVQSEMLTNEKREHVVLMDDYGASHHVYIPVLLGSTRQQVIQDHITQMQNRQIALEAYAATHGHDISAQKTAGTAKKQSLIAKNKPTSFVSAPEIAPVPLAPVAVASITTEVPNVLVPIVKA